MEQREYINTGIDEELIDLVDRWAEEVPQPVDADHFGIEDIAGLGRGVAHLGHPVREQRGAADRADAARQADVLVTDPDTEERPRVTLAQPSSAARESASASPIHGLPCGLEHPLTGGLSALYSLRVSEWRPEFRHRREVLRTDVPSTRPDEPFDTVYDSTWEPTMRAFDSDTV